MRRYNICKFKEDKVMFWTHFVRGWNKFFLTIIIIATCIGCLFLLTELGVFALLLIPIVVLISFAFVAFIMMISEISINLNEINNKLNQMDTSANNNSNQNNNSNSNNNNNNNSNNSNQINSNNIQQLKNISPIRQLDITNHSSDSVGKVLDGFWNCSCGARNSNSCVSCSICGRNKDQRNEPYVPKAPTPSIPSPKPNISDIARKMNTDKWICTCGSENLLTSKFCFNCGSAKSNQFWTCPNCGDENKNTTLYCKGCGKTK